MEVRSRLAVEYQKNNKPILLNHTFQISGKSMCKELLFVFNSRKKTGESCLAIFTRPNIRKKAHSQEKLKM